MKKSEIQEMITNQVIEALETNKTLWVKGWKPIMPVNAVTVKGKKKAYKGINTFLLSLMAMTKGYSSNEWATAKQIEALKGRVKEGAKSTTIYFNNRKVEKDEETGKTSVRWISMTYQVYNLDQTSLKPATVKAIASTGKANREVEKAIILSKCPITEIAGDKACYTPSQDKIVMPMRNQFKSLDGFYGVVLHEMAHSTGHHDRLDRRIRNLFGSEEYALEELVAEMSSMFLMAHYNVSNNDTEINSVAYLQSWLKALKNDKRCIFTASNQAQRVLEYITTGSLTNESGYSIKNEYKDSVLDTVETTAEVYRSGKNIYKKLNGSWYNGKNELLDKPAQIQHIERLIKSGIVKQVTRELVTA